VPDTVSDEKAVFAEPLAAACEILAQVAVDPTSRILVLGDGKLGLLAAAVLRLTGAEVTVLGRHSSKLRIAEAWGVHCRLVGQADQADDLDLLRGADIVVECTGNSAGFRAGRRLVRPRGTLILKSTYHGNLDVDVSGLVVDEVTVVGSRCGPFAPALRLLEQGLVDPTPLVSSVYPLSRAEAAFERACDPGVLKVLLQPDEFRDRRGVDRAD
jgi:threonine dehydrogenase-like Zn-dependent dehydrogenase